MSKIKLETIVNFTYQFSSMVNAKIPMLKILSNLQKDTMDKNFAAIIEEIKEDLKKGMELADAMKKHPNAFNSIYINMIRAGTESGKLSVTLKQLSIYLKKESITKNKIKSALTYPKFMLFSMLFIVGLLLIQLIPMFERMFKNSNQELPAMTQLLISLSEFLREYSLVLIVLGFLIYSGIKVFLLTNDGKLFFDRLKLNLWFIGKLNYKSSISKFIRTLGVLSISKIQILKALQLSKSSASNIIIERKIEEIALLIEKGYGISEAFKKVDVFPEIVIQMITSGEESDQLGELLINSSDYYDDQIDNELKSLIDLINPILTIVMGIFIAVVMLAIFMPIFNLGNTF